jgi:Fe-S cluster biosynthesis and repair protein YggX
LSSIKENQTHQGLRGAISHVYRERRGILVGSVRLSTNFLRALGNTALNTAELARDVAGLAAVKMMPASYAAIDDETSWLEPLHAYRERKDRFGLTEWATSMFHTEQYAGQQDAADLLDKEHQDQTARLRGEIMAERATAYTDIKKYVWEEWIHHAKVDAFNKTREIVDREHRLYLDSLNDLKRIDYVKNGVASRLTSTTIDGVDVDLKGAMFATSFVRNMGDPLQFTAGKLYSFLLSRAETFVGQQFPQDQRERVMTLFDLACHRTAEGWYPSSFSQ